jgi:small conductance mechanosensitive channel
LTCQEDTQVNLETIQTPLSTTPIDIGHKVLAAIAFWVIGRWLIGHVMSMDRSGMHRNKIDPCISERNIACAV